MTDVAVPSTSETALAPVDGAKTVVRRVVKRKPARKQVEVGQIEKKQPEQTGQTYNIWYGKWAGGDKQDSYNIKEKSQTRCDIKKDAGYTRADIGAGKTGEYANSYCCLFFARGCCPYGSECSYLHRLPLPLHKLPDTSLDCFGREKFSDYRDDMGGVGSFTRINRTLYVGRLHESRNTAEVVQKHFEDWGEIERIKILNNRGVAFVTYVSELNAQFAKEAMQCQSMDHDEILNVRWATEDPNPTAKVAEKRRLEQLGEEGIAKKLDPAFVQAVRQLDDLEKTAADWGPNTDEGRRILGREAPASIEDASDQNDDLQEFARDEPPAKRVRVDPPHSTLPAAGLLSASTMDGLKYVAQLKAHAPVSAPAANLGGLGDYGSDEE